MKLCRNIASTVANPSSAENGDDAASVERDFDSGWSEAAAGAELVNRRMHFLHGVPHEYAWSTSDERIRDAVGWDSAHNGRHVAGADRERESFGDGAHSVVRELAETGRARRVRLFDVFKESGNFGGEGGVG